MTEKEKVLAEVMRHFMDKADEWRRSGDTHSFEGSQKLVSAGQWDAAAVEVAGLGANQETIRKAVERYVRQIKSPFLHHDFMHRAIHMARKGSPHSTVEELIQLLVRHYCTGWAIEYLEELAALLGRKPTGEEIFALVELERKNQTSWDQNLHQELVSLAKRHLSYEDVERVQGMIKDKIREWRSHADI